MASVEDKVRSMEDTASRYRWVLTTHAGYAGVFCPQGGHSRQAGGDDAQGWEYSGHSQEERLVT